MKLFINNYWNKNSVCFCLSFSNCLCCSTSCRYSLISNSTSSLLLLESFSQKICSAKPFSSSNWAATSRDLCLNLARCCFVKNSLFKRIWTKNPQFNVILSTLVLSFKKVAVPDLFFLQSFFLSRPQFIFDNFQRQIFRYQCFILFLLLFGYGIFLPTNNSKSSIVTN